MDQLMDTSGPIQVFINLRAQIAMCNKLFWIKDNFIMKKKKKSRLHFLPLLSWSSVEVSIIINVNQLSQEGIMGQHAD